MDKHYVTELRPLTADTCFLSEKIWRKMAANAEKAGEREKAALYHANADEAFRTALFILEGRYQQPKL